MPPEVNPPPAPTQPSSGNNIWILPAHAPNTAPPYRFYPSASDGIAGPNKVMLFVFFQKTPAPDSFTLSSDVQLQYELAPSPASGGTTSSVAPDPVYVDSNGVDIPTGGLQALYINLTGSVPSPNGAVVSLPVMLSAELNGQLSKVIVELHSHPLLPTTVPNPS